MLKKIRVDQGVGQNLLHDITGIKKDGTKGVVFKRGHRLTKEDIELLKDTGEEHIYVGELPDGYVHEEDAATRLAKEVVGNNIYTTGPSEGKIGIHAEVDGMFILNSKGLVEVNSVGDYTLATKKNYSDVKKGDLLCGLRIVPLYTTEENVIKAIDVAKNNYPLFEVKEYRKLKVGVIITGTEIYEGRIKDKFEGVLRPKLEKFDTEILGFKKAPDNLEYINNLLKEYLDQGADLVLFTGGMSVDPDDLTPTAIKESGAELITQGVPVQPGNMLTIGKLDTTYLVGVPGASLNSKITSFDTILPRIYAGVDIKKEDLVSMGEGGLY